MTRSIFTCGLLTLFVARNFVVQAQAMSSTAGNYSVAYVTTGSKEVAKNLARGLVSEKLAACVNIIPQITSIYEWKGKIEEDEEFLMMIKTRTETVDRLTEYVKKNHPYEVCEVISVKVDNGNKQYLDWIDSVVSKK